MGIGKDCLCSGRGFECKAQLEESEVGRFWWLLHSKLIGLIWIPSEWASVSQSLVIGLGNGRLHYFNCWKESMLSVAWEPLGFTLSVPGCVAAVWCISRILVASLAVFPSSLRTSLFQLSRQPGFTCGVQWPSQDAKMAALCSEVAHPSQSRLGFLQNSRRKC